jgi:long-chain acyl-CoA synthetase
LTSTPNLIELIYQHADVQPDATALICGNTTLSAGELRNIVDRCAAELLRQGFADGDRLGIQLRDTWEFVAVLLAAIRISVTVVPLDWRASPREIERLADHFALTGIARVPGSPDIHGSQDLITISVDGAWLRNLPDSGMPLPPVNHTTPFLISLSSGTTGEPKGMYCTFEEFTARLQRNLESFGALSGVRYLSCLPLCFSGGLFYCLYNLCLGNVVILYPTLFAPQELIKAVKEHRATLLIVVPTILRWLLKLPASRQALLHDLTFLINTGGPLTPNEKTLIVKQVCENFYDIFSTAAAGMLCVAGPDDIATAPEILGRAAPNIELEIVDSDGRAVAIDTPGRLRCRGPGISDSIWEGDKDIDRSEGIDDGWYFTGDIAAIDSNGRYYLHGRADNVINRGGVNIYPNVIEAALREHPKVNEVIVFGKPEPQLGEYVTAAVVATDQVSDADLSAYCRDKLAPHLVPEEFIFSDSLPKTSTGKIKLQ